jgi:hypothetical protein
MKAIRLPGGRYRIPKSEVKRLGGHRLGGGAIMLPAEAFREIEEFFSQNGVKYRKIAVNLLFVDL